MQCNAATKEATSHWTNLVVARRPPLWRLQSPPVPPGSSFPGHLEVQAQWEHSPSQRAALCIVSVAIERDQRGMEGQKFDSFLLLQIARFRSILRGVRV